MSETWTGPSGTYALIPAPRTSEENPCPSCAGCDINDPEECAAAPCEEGGFFILRRKESNPSYSPEGVRCIYEALSGHVILARPCDEANAVILLNSTLAAMDAAVEKMEADTKRAMEALDEAKDAVTKCEEEAAAKDAEIARLRDYVGDEMLRSDYQTAGHMRNALQRAEQRIRGVEEELSRAKRDHAELLAIHELTACVAGGGLFFSPPLFFVKSPLTPTTNGRMLCPWSRRNPRRPRLGEPGAAKENRNETIKSSPPSRLQTPQGANPNQCPRVR